MTPGPRTLGLDLGGAHLKLALVEAGRIRIVRQLPCRLWEGIDRLGEALEAGTADLGTIDRVALTMTGELADLFPDRATGVRRLVEAAHLRFPQHPLLVWAGVAGFLLPEAVPGREALVASTNWLTTASWLARHLEQAILVDMGSTTTDILLLADGVVQARGTTDRERLAQGELVYQGLTRTPLMAIARSAPFEGVMVPLMNEHFATSADCWRLMGRLDEGHDQHPAADGGPKTAEASARRLARMIGADLAEADLEDWTGLARWFTERQERLILDAITLQLSRDLVPPSAPLVVAGCGAGVVAGLATRLGRPCLDLTTLLPVAPAQAAWAGVCAPAAAVALLADQPAE